MHYIYICMYVYTIYIYIYMYTRYIYIYIYTCIPYIYTIYNYYNSCIYNIIYIDTDTLCIIYLSHWTFFWWIDVVQPAVLFFCIHMYTFYIYIYTTYNYYNSCIYIYIYIILCIVIQIHYYIYIYPIEPSFGGLMLFTQLCTICILPWPGMPIQLPASICGLTSQGWYDMQLVVEWLRLALCWLSCTLW